MSTMNKIDSAPQLPDPQPSHHPAPQPGYQPDPQPGYQPGPQPGYHPGPPPPHPGQPQYNHGYVQQGPPPAGPYGGPMMMQPQMTTNTVVVQQPTMPSVVIQGQRGWSSGICACCDDVTMCLCVGFFPQCYEMHLASKMGENCCLPCCVPGSLIAMRAHFRGKQNIGGSIFDDCCMAMCCYQCVMCQLSREVNMMNNTRLVVQQPLGVAPTTVVTHSH